MPIDQQLFQVENYEQFLTKRRELLAENANQFLDSLINNSSDDIEIQNYANRSAQDISLYDDEDILDVGQWMRDKGLPEGLANFELIDEKGNVLMIIDIAWPQGIQSELSEPLALLKNESDSNYGIVNRYGYKYFTNLEEFKSYIEAHYIQS